MIEEQRPGFEIDREIIKKAIDRATSFLCETQLPSGEFTCLLSSDPSMNFAVPDSTPFITCSVIYALGFVDGDRIEEAKGRALEFLASEMEFGGVWRYFGRTRFKHCRVPPDLDDTACASYALLRNRRPVPNNRWIFELNRDQKGRFLTWILPDSRAGLLSPQRLRQFVGDQQAEGRRRRAPQPAHVTNPRFAELARDPISPDDVDPVVCANVLLYLGEDASTEATKAWLIETVREAKQDFSIYYKDPAILYYAVARAMYHGCSGLGVLRDVIVNRICEDLARSESLDPLRAALFASTLLMLDRKNRHLNELTENILRAQQVDGSWPARPYYSGPEEFWGSPQLTTAFCLEALARQEASDIASGEDSRCVATRRIPAWRVLARPFIRPAEWWFYKIPFCILAFLMVLRTDFSWNVVLALTSLIAIVSAVANYGHAINELFDRKEDRLAQKANIADILGVPFLYCVAGGSALVGIALACWAAGTSAAVITAMALIAPTLYSVPPVRLKERRWLGVFADALAAHVFPSLLALELAGEFSNGSDRFYIVVSIWSFMAGVRAILGHQVHTEERDSRADLQTVVHELGAPRTARAILVGILPFELAAFVVFAFLSPSALSLIAAAVFYLWIEAAKSTIGQRRASLSVEGLSTTPLTSLSIYFVWAPLAAIFSLTVLDLNYALLIPVLVLLFWPVFRDGLLEFTTLIYELFFRRSGKSEIADNVGLIGSTGEFDKKWYLDEYRDAAASGMDAIEHYCKVGWSIGYNPNPEFSTNGYLAKNADIASAGVNPFVHYLRHGRAEGRRF